MDHNSKKQEVFFHQELQHITFVPTKPLQMLLQQQTKLFYCVRTGASEERILRI
jgi:hypothetical protein